MTEGDTGLTVGVLVVLAVVLGVSLLASRTRRRRASVPLLSDKSPVLVDQILLLGPAAAGKTALMRHACALSDELEGAPSAAFDPSREYRYQPTLGLVRQVLTLPTGDGAVRAQVCDAGGGRAQQRQWVTMIREGNVGALVFVADVSDGSEVRAAARPDIARGRPLAAVPAPSLVPTRSVPLWQETLSLYSQLANAPWARTALLYLALTKVDLLPPHRRRELCEGREVEYRQRCPRPLRCSWLCATVRADAATLLAEVAGAAGRRALGTTSLTSYS